MSSTINANDIDIQEAFEKESVNVDIDLDIVVVTKSETYTDIESSYSSIIEKNIDDSCNAREELKMELSPLCKVVNDSIKRYTTDSNIDSIKIGITVPKDIINVSDVEIALTGKQKVFDEGNRTVIVENEALANNKVTPLFELSIEKNVEYGNSLDKMSNDKSSEIKKSKNSISSTTSCIQLTQSSNDDITKLNSNDSNISDKDLTMSPEEYNKLINDTYATRDYLSKLGNNISIAGDSIDETAKVLTSQNLGLKVGNNGKLYFKEMARGNGRGYTIAGNLRNIGPAIKKIGYIGQAISFVNELPEFKNRLDNAESIHEVLEISGEEIGKESGSFLGGWAGGSIGTNIGIGIISIAAGAGITLSAPVSVLIIGTLVIVGGYVGSQGGSELGKSTGGFIGKEAGMYIEESNNTIHYTMDKSSN